jgi:hypothetical protein
MTGVCRSADAPPIEQSIQRFRQVVGGDTVMEERRIERHLP